MDYARFIEEHDGEIAGPAPEKQIARLEKKLGVKLPGAYRSFLASCGAADIEAQEINGIPGEDEEIGLDLVEFVEEFREGFPGWPDHMIPIMDDGRGGAFCLDLSGAPTSPADDCPVAYFEHEFAEEDEATGLFTFELEQVADSFDAWLKRVAETGSGFDEEE
jgi:cell wall assembly regulator SMI1